MFHIIISYFVLFHEVLFYVKSKMKVLCALYRKKKKLEIQEAPLAQDPPPACGLKKKNSQAPLFVCLFYALVLFCHQPPV